MTMTLNIGHEIIDIPTVLSHVHDKQAMVIYIKKKQKKRVNFFFTYFKLKIKKSNFKVKIV